MDSTVHLSRQRLTSIANGEPDRTKVKDYDLLGKFTKKQQAIDILDELHNQDTEKAVANYSHTLSTVSELKSLIDNPLELLARRSSTGITFTWKIDIPPSNRVSLANALSSTDISQIATFGYGWSNLSHSHNPHTHQNTQSSYFSSETNENPTKIEHSFTVPFEQLVVDFIFLPQVQQQLLEKVDEDFFAAVRILSDTNASREKKLTSFDKVLASTQNFSTLIFPSPYGLLIQLAGEKSQSVASFTMSIERCFSQLANVSPQLQQKLLAAIASEPVFLFKHTETLLANFSKFNLEQQTVINTLLLKELANPPTVKPAWTLGRIADFNTLQQREITAAFTKDIKKHLKLILRNFDYFTKEEQAEIREVLIADPDFFMKNAELLLQHQQIFERPQLESVLQEFLEALDVDPSAALRQLEVLFAYHEHLSVDQKRDLQGIVLSNTSKIMEEDVGVILKYLHLLPTQEDQDAVIRFVMDEALSTPLNDILANCAEFILPHYALLTKEDCAKIDKLFPANVIAETCGFDYGGFHPSEEMLKATNFDYAAFNKNVPNMSTKERLLCLAMMKFHQKHSASVDAPPIAWKDRTIYNLVYLVYRPEESPSVPLPVPGKKEVFIGKEDALAKFNWGQLDIRNAFNRVGYQKVGDKVVFAPMNPLIGFQMQNNPFYCLKNPSVLGAIDGKTAQQVMTERHILLYGHPSYEAFMADDEGYQQSLTEIYEAHGGTLVIIDPVSGECRNRLS